ncbi:MAG: aldo/keto reductase [Bacteroidota bacterium]
MELISLGKTGLKVTKIGLGLAALGRPGYITLNRNQDLGNSRDVKSMQKATFKVLDSAWMHGIRYFDVARSYGLSEKFLAEWLEHKNIKADELVVGSKWGYVYNANWEVSADKHEIKYHTLENYKRQKEESFGILRDYLKLYQIHSATLESGVLEDPEIINALAQLKSEGVKIGLSLSGPNQSKTLIRALEVKIDNVLLFDTVQATWNILETSVGHALSQAKSEGLGVIIKEALANGRLFHINELSKDKSAVVSNAISQLNTTADAFAMACALQEPFSDVVLSGAATVKQLESNIKVERLSKLIEIPVFAEEPVKYWKKRSELPWN